MKTFNEYIASFNELDEATERTGDKKLDAKYDAVVAALKAAEDCEKAANKVYDKICRKLGIKETRKESKYSTNNRKIVEKEPDYKAAWKEVMKAQRNYAKITLEFKKMYDEYIKNGGKQIKDYYIAAHNWDDED